MADFTVDVPKRDTRPVTFGFSGDTHEYSFRPPKNAEAFNALLEAAPEDEMASSRVSIDWLKNGLSSEDFKHLRGRLDDDNDGLDIEVVIETIVKLQEFIADRPTG